MKTNYCKFKVIHKSKKEIIKELKKENDDLYKSNIGYSDRLLEYKRRYEDLLFKVNQKEDIADLIRKVRRIYLDSLDNDLFNQYITLVKLYNKIGE